MGAHRRHFLGPFSFQIGWWRISGSAGENVRSIVKAHDVRGLVGIELTADRVRALGWAFARLVGRPPLDADSIVICHDIRDSSPQLASALPGRRQADQAWTPDCRPSASRPLPCSTV